jgi:hypothetical protein
MVTTRNESLLCNIVCQRRHTCQHTERGVSAEKRQNQIASGGNFQICTRIEKMNIAEYWSSCVRILVSEIVCVVTNMLS